MKPSLLLLFLRLFLGDFARGRRGTPRDRRPLVRAVALLLVGGLVSGLPSPALAQSRPGQPDGDAPTGMRIRADVVKRGPALRGAGGSGANASLTADGRYVVSVGADGVYAAKPDSTKPKRLTEHGTWFAPTPDGRFVVVRAGGFTKVSIDGKKTVPLALDEKPGSTAHAVVSNQQLAFVNAAGQVMLVDLNGSKPVMVDLPTPADKRCHTGAGVPRGFSPDGRWLSVQHGCDEEYLVDPNGGVRKLPFVSARFAEGYVIGTPKEQGRMGSSVVVLNPATNETWTLPDVAYSPFRVVVPRRLAFLQVVDGTLQLVDLRSKTVTKLEDGSGDVTGFVSTTPDGSTGLYSVHDDGHCSIRSVELATGKTRLLADVEGGQQCFVKPVGNDQAAAYFWRAGPTVAIAARVHLETGVVEQLGEEIPWIGSLHTAGRTLLISAQIGLLVGTAK